MNGDIITLTFSEEQIRDIAGCLAELWIAVNETKVVEQDKERVARLARTSDHIKKVEDVFRYRAEAKRAEDALRRAASSEEGQP